MKQLLDDETRAEAFIDAVSKLIEEKEDINNNGTERL